MKRLSLVLSVVDDFTAPIRKALLAAVLAAVTPLLVEAVQSFADTALAWLAGGGLAAIVGRIVWLVPNRTT